MNPETLLMLFKSDPMQNLFKRNCTGTILTAVSHNELKKIPVPKIRAEVQAEIAENVQKSISLRGEAKSLLEGAKQEVEDAIEYEFARGGVQVNSNSQENADYDALIEQSVYYYRLAEWLLLQELLLHLTVTDSAFLPDYITLVLNSVVVRMQAERDSNGAIIQHWKPDDIKKVIIPALAMKTQRQIAEKVRRSFALRTESGRLLEQAKEMVEAEIEGRQM